MTVPAAARIHDLNNWLIESGVNGRDHTEMLEGYCQQLLDMGVPLMRAHVAHTALHPVYGAFAFQWRDKAGSESEAFERQNGVSTSWQDSPFYYMISTETRNYRESLWDSNVPSRFPLLNEMRQEGATDYLAAIVPFDRTNETAQSPHEGVKGALMSWMSNAPEGFSDDDLAVLLGTLPALSLAMKSQAQEKTAQDLLGIYLGKDAGRRVLSGEILRGSSDWIDAVICYFDLEGFTNMSQQVAGEELIGMLNDYFGVVVEHIEGRGGNVLKFMGDGILAIFDRAALDDAPKRALKAARGIKRGMADVSATREAAGQPTFNYTLALHAGPVLYGNIGGNERLDFTVIGPEVNLAARLSGMHKSLGQRVIISQALEQNVPAQKFDLVSLGRYMLRGVDTPQELFTLYDPDVIV